MDPAEVVVGNVQGDRRNVIIQLLAKAVYQPGEPALAHAKRKVLPLNVAGRNVLIRFASSTSRLTATTAAGEYRP